jgi:hypothetical protein
MSQCSDRTCCHDYPIGAHDSAVQQAVSTRRRLESPLSPAESSLTPPPSPAATDRALIETVAVPHQNRLK